MKCKMHRIKTHGRFTRITELDQIPSRVYALSWAIWRLSSLSGWAEFPLSMAKQYAISTYLNYYNSNKAINPCMCFEAQCFPVTKPH